MRELQYPKRMEDRQMTDEKKVVDEESVNSAPECECGADAVA